VAGDQAPPATAADTTRKIRQSQASHPVREARTKTREIQKTFYHRFSWLKHSQKLTVGCIFRRSTSRVLERTNFGSLSATLQTAEPIGRSIRCRFNMTERKRRSQIYFL